MQIFVNLVERLNCPVYSVAPCTTAHRKGCFCVKFAVKDYQEALNVLESVSDDSANKCSIKSVSSSQLMMSLDSSSFSVC